jgi:hypothetical protein
LLSSDEFPRRQSHLRGARVWDVAAAFRSVRRCPTA